ncbi:hypothetical protein JOL79_11620 [Microbispora sp. RL4-1S]|uniref:Uncharacterized protein n=1 Tax=Microbispora oryzae TaxID=2806554 RepID=A0A940WKB7_9ACTN|nr:hypothetical protein [Microbispora oryzae]MBP2704463.1 hypothetical protein [Microbispora oryzae]
MRNLTALIAGVEEDLEHAAALDVEAGVDSSEWVEVRRVDLQALLEAARQHSGCHTGWITLGPGALEAVREHIGGGRD